MRLCLLSLFFLLAAPFPQSFGARYSSGSGRGSAVQDSSLVVWYRQPAGKWLEALPLGNGLMGAMVFGGVSEERIALNESSFWSGRPQDYANPGALAYFPQIARLVAGKHFAEAEKMADEHFFGIPAAQQAFQPLADLRLFFDFPSPAAAVTAAPVASDYRRSLDLYSGISTVRYRIGDIVYTRETFLSYPDRALAVRLSASRPGMITVRAELNSHYREHLSVKGNSLTLTGAWQGPMEKDWLIAPVEGRGIGFETVLQTRAEGGQRIASDTALIIKGADAVTFLLTAATSYKSYHDITGDPAAACAKVVTALKTKTYRQLRERHTRDFSGFMTRVALETGDKTLNQHPTDERLEAMAKGAEDPNLEALAFQFGRYLLLSASRAGGQPPNLQGIWNEAVLPPWGSKYTININTEMNYWPAEVTNLSECHQPLMQLLKDISITGARTAKQYYGLNGWVAHHNTDLWRGTAPTDAARFGMWPMGGAWLCQDIWEHYVYTNDLKFLAEYYPVMKGAAQFLLELMVTDPDHGWLVTPFSMSPEHGYYDKKDHEVFLSPSPTLDIAIIRELFPHCIAAARLLNLDAAFREKLANALTRLPPYQIGHAGFLREWLEDWEPAPAGHIVSPNFTLYPGSSIRLHRDTALAAAIERWMEAHPANEGFPDAWDIAVWARLERADRTTETISRFVGNSLAPNLHNKGSNQSDASFGFTAAVAESLLQSHEEDIRLLPALSLTWKEGRIRGLRARGGYEISMSWKKGRLASATLRNINGTGSVRVSYRQKQVSLNLPPGQTIRLNGDLVKQ